MGANQFLTYYTELQKARKLLPDAVAKAAKVATIRAVEAAADVTPPKAGTGRGPYIGSNTITGDLKQGWAKDSQIEPDISGGTVRTALNNNVPYASYVNDGHRLARHFVPGLYIDPHSGLLEYDPSADVGIVVGTKTKYVKGEFMVDKAIKAYQETLQSELGMRVREVFQ